MKACSKHGSPGPQPLEASARNVAFCIGAAVLLAFGSSCSAVAGAGAATVAVTAGALASTCYGYVDVKVVDSRTGGPTCEAEVIARDEDGDETALRSCFHAALGEGKWTLTARKAGYLDATSAIDIQMPDGCPRITYTTVMTLERVGQPKSGLTALRPAAPPAARPTPRPGAEPPAAPAATAPTSISTPSASTPPETTKGPPAAKPAPGAAPVPGSGPVPSAKPPPSTKPAPDGTPAPAPSTPPKTPSRPQEKPENPYGRPA